MRRGTGWTKRRDGCAERLRRGRRDFGAAPAVDADAEDCWEGAIEMVPREKMGTVWGWAVEGLCEGSAASVVARAVAWRQIRSAAAKESR